MELVKWQVSGPFNQKAVGVNLWVCCLLLIRNDVPDIQRHPLGPLFWWAALRGTLLQSQLLVMFCLPFLFLQCKPEFLKWLTFGSRIWGEGCPLHYRMFNSMPGLYLLNAKAPSTQLWQPKYLQTLPHLPLGAKSFPLENWNRQIRIAYAISNTQKTSLMLKLQQLALPVGSPFPLFSTHSFGSGLWLLSEHAFVREHTNQYTSM